MTLLSNGIRCSRNCFTFHCKSALALWNLSSSTSHVLLWSVLESCCSATAPYCTLISIFFLPFPLVPPSLLCLSPFPLLPFAVWRVGVLLKVRESLILCFPSLVLSSSDFQPIKHSMPSALGTACVSRNNLRPQNLFGSESRSLKHNNIVLR